MSRDHSQNHYGPNASFDGYDSDLASAGILIESLRQQLSAALAACKLKDEELEKIRGHIGLYNLFSCVGSDSYDPECADLNVGKCREIATKALAIRPGTERTEMSKLFCDCKTDEEKSNFFLSGQGVETGIIAPAISNEVAMAFHRCFEFEKQLAAVIAACKLKDEALQNCEGMLDELRDYPITHDAIIEALAIQPDDSALKAWVGEPVSFLYKHNSGFGDGHFWTHRPTHNGVTALETKALYSPKPSPPSSLLPRTGT